MTEQTSTTGSDSPELTRSIYRAVADSKLRRHEAVTLEHLLVSILEEDDVTAALKGLNIEVVSITDAMAIFLDGGFINSIDDDSIPHPTRAFDEVVTRAVGMAMFSAKPSAMPIDLLVHLLQQPAEDSFAVTCLNQAGLTSLALKRFLAHGTGSAAETANQSGMPPGMEGMGPAKEITTREEAEAILAKYAANLNETAGKGGIDPLIGREDEVAMMIQILARRSKNNLALVGEPGVGKTAIAEGLAVKIVANEVPDVLAGSVVYSLDIGALMAGARFRGDMEERLKQVLKSLTFVPNAILFIDEIHTIMGTGAGQSGSLDIANLLKPALANGSLKCIGSTTNEEYRKHFEKDRALQRRFKRVDVFEPSIEDAKAILFGLKSRFEEFHKVTYTDEAIEAAVDLTARYVTNQLLPDKAIDILDNAGARQRVAPEASRLTVITLAEIEVEVSKVAKIPAKIVKDDESTKLSTLEDDLKAAVFGQDTALAALADAVFVSRSGLRDTNKPAGAFMFAGPTGVGKTEAARQLATTLGIPLLKYDMSEYMEKHAVSKLIGSPPGYVGYSDGGSGSGKLVNDIEQNPYAVLLLDEIEKAHPDVFNVLLQVMDDAKLTSSAGKTVSFRNIILIMTTNAGASEASKNGIGFGASTQGGDPTAAINRTFSPEFRNRLDTTVMFSRLQQANVLRVVNKFLSALETQARDRQVEIEVTTEAREWLAKNGFNPAMGARPLARSINDNIKTPLSRLMVVGPLKNGGRALVTVENNKLKVEAA
jgi:ATP-dependent Clp protease ATP-binding subunit ClpA